MRIACKSTSLLSLFLIGTLTGKLAAQMPAPLDSLDRAGAKVADTLSAKLLRDNPKDDELRALMRKRYRAGLEEMNEWHALFRVGRTSINEVIDVDKRVLQSGLELCETQADRIALLTQRVHSTEMVCKLAQAKHEVGLGTTTDSLRARYQLLDAQIELLRAKREADEGPPALRE